MDLSMSNRDDSNHVEKNVPSRATKKVYEAPRIETEEIFERQAVMACGKIQQFPVNPCTNRTSAS